MRVHKAYRYELDPNAEQRVLLAKSAGAARFAYNWGLARRKQAWQEEHRTLHAEALHRELNALKATQFPWLYEVSKCAPQEALRDLERAFENFFKHRARYPKFKKKGKHDSFRLTGSIRVFPRAVQLPRLGRVRTKESTAKLQGRLLSATVSREADRWFVSLSVEAEIPDPQPPAGEAAAVDLGLTDFAVFPDGEKVDGPKPLARSLKRLRRLSRRQSRKRKGSANFKKAARKVARLNRKIKNQRKDFLAKLSTRLAKIQRAVVIEDLAVKNLQQNKHLSRAIGDAGWGEFRRMLTYKTSWYGSELLVAPRFYASSKRCSGCGYVLPELPLSVRRWTCPQCGAEHDRDVNAARNLLAWALEPEMIETTASSAGSHACGDRLRRNGLDPVYEQTVTEAGSLCG